MSVVHAILALAQLSFAVPVPSHATRHDARATAPSARLTIDSARHVVVVSVGPVVIPASVPYDQHVGPAPIEIEWPVSGWIRGFRIDVVDSSGRALSRELLHHAGIANTDRRQLMSPAAERLIAAGRETDALLLPESMGVPLDRGSHLLVYFALVNPTYAEIAGATLRVELAWTQDGAAVPRNVLPFALDAYPVLGAPSTFDAPPGRSEQRREFTLPVGGHLRALGGHLHDYGVELRLEDVASGKVLARIAATRTADGRVTDVARTRFFLKRHGLRLDANRRYRIVGLYDNPTDSTIHGAMAGLVGAFTPDDVRRWPALDRSDPVYRADHAWLLNQESTHGSHDHM
jgi:hypothetical protein